MALPTHGISTRRQGRAKFHRSGCQLHPVVLYHGGETAGDASDRQSIYGQVAITGRCIGADSDPLVRAILAHQQGLNHPYKDGRVSIAKGDQKLGDFAFMVYRIGARIAYIYPREWPRLDLSPVARPQRPVPCRKQCPSSRPTSHSPLSSECLIPVCVDRCLPCW